MSAHLFEWISAGFALHSGGVTNWKIECDALTPADWDTLARLVAARVQFGAVEGVPRGGLPFAAALEPFTSTGPVLIVDDVWTTGRSMEEYRAGRNAIGVVAFARQPVAATWVQAVLTVSLDGPLGGTP